VHPHLSHGQELEQVDTPCQPVVEETSLEPMWGAPGMCSIQDSKFGASPWSKIPEEDLVQQMRPMDQKSH